MEIPISVPDNNSLTKQKRTKINLPKMIFSEESLCEKKKTINNLQILKYHFEIYKQRADNITQECLKSISKLETMVFDIYLTKYIFNECTLVEIEQFIKICLGLQINFSNLNLDLIENHLIYLYDIINNNLPYLYRNKDKRNEYSKKPIEIIHFIDETKNQLENEISQIKNDFLKSGNNTRPSTPQNVDSINIDESFIEWIQKNLILTNESNSETTNLRNLFFCSIHRYNNILELQNKLKNLKENIIKPKTIDYTMCGLNSLLNSPFFLSVKSNYKFLTQTLNNIQLYRKKLIPLCNQQIKKCENSLINLKEKGEKTKSELINQTNLLQQNLNRRQSEVNDLRNELEPFIKRLTLSNDTQINDLFKSITQIDFDIETKLKEIQLNTTNINEKNDIKKDFEIFNQLKNIRHDVSTLSFNTITTMKSALCTENAIFNVVCEHLKNEETNRLFSREIEQLNKFENYLQEFNELLKVKDITLWSNEIDKISLILNEVDNDYLDLKNIIDSLINNFNENELEKEIELYQKEIDELFIENKNLDQEDYQLDLEISNSTEELFSTIQEIELLQKTSADEFTLIEEKKIQKFQSYITCPICKINDRDCIISTCLHPICRSCLEKSGKKCPVCNNSFSNDDVKPFFLK